MLHEIIATELRDHDEVSALPFETSGMEPHLTRFGTHSAKPGIHWPFLWQVELTSVPLVTRGEKFLLQVIEIDVCAETKLPA